MAETELLTILWYAIFVIALICYAALDGFDLGVGILHPFMKEDYERRVLLNAIGPVWDGNAVWLVIVMGSLLAGFPGAYAAILSSFYTPVMIFIAGLILRAVAIEFRSKERAKWWRATWDYIFFLGSSVIAFGAGLFLGNLIEGIALNQDGVYLGGFLDFFTPYSVMVGITAFACFALHGAIFLLMKTEGALYEKIKRFVKPLMIFFILSYALTTLMTLIYQTHMLERLQQIPELFIFVILSLLAIANIPREISLGHHGRAFLSSAASIAFLLALYGIGSFPVLLRSTINPAAYSLTVFNADSSAMTLKVLLTIVGIGLPLVALYGIIIARVFRGKVHLNDHSY